MIKILAIGDSHIPRRAKAIPSQVSLKLNQLTENEKYDYTFFTGDVVKADNFLKFLDLNTKRNVFIVIGNMDYFGGDRDTPVSHRLTISMNGNNNLKIGLIHGHQISPRGDRSQLESIAIDNDYNILISGHTHKEEVFLTKKGILLLNPGSVTGAWSFIASGNPSFITLSINEETREINVSLYQLAKRFVEINEVKSSFMMENNKIRYF